jgi:hypothetical protein
MALTVFKATLCIALANILDSVTSSIRLGVMDIIIVNTSPVLATTNRVVGPHGDGVL